MPNTRLNVIILSQRHLVRKLLGEFLVARCGARIVAELDALVMPPPSLSSAQLLVADPHEIPAAHLETWLETLLADRPQLRTLIVDDSLPGFSLNGVVAAAVASSPAVRVPHELLTPLETEVLVAVASGKRNSEIARHMRRSPKTVEKHRANAQRKLGFRNVAQLTAYAIRYGLLEADVLLGQRNRQDC